MQQRVADHRPHTNHSTGFADRSKLELSTPTPLQLAGAAPHDRPTPAARHADPARLAARHADLRRLAHRWDAFSRTFGSPATAQRLRLWSASA